MSLSTYSNDELLQELRKRNSEIEALGDELNREVAVERAQEVQQAMSEAIPEEEVDNIPVNGIDRGSGVKYKCSACGTMTTLPFVPRSNAAVFCRDCYAKRRK